MIRLALKVVQRCFPLKSAKLGIFTYLANPSHLIETGLLKHISSILLLKPQGHIFPHKWVFGFRNNRGNI